jgi:hypothetical protein
MQTTMALPNFRVSIVKSLNNEVWSNDYLLNVADIGAAESKALDIKEFERQMHYSTVHFDYMRISTTSVGDRIFRHTVLNSFGIIDATGNDFLPLYCCMRLDLKTADSDPARKYYRLPVTEGHQSAGIFTSAALTAFTTKVTTYFIATSAYLGIVTSKGHAVIDASISDKVQMRQLSRRRRHVAA